MEDYAGTPYPEGLPDSKAQRLVSQSLYYRKGVTAIVSNLLDWTLSNAKTGGIRRMGAA